MRTKYVFSGEAKIFFANGLKESFKFGISVKVFARTKYKTQIDANRLVTI